MEYTFSTREKNGSVCLILSYKVNGVWKQKTKQGFKSRKEAKRYQDKLLAKAEKDAVPSPDPELEDITLGEFLPIFLRDRREELTYTTRISYRNAVRRLTGLLDKPVEKITTPMIMNALGKLNVSTASRNLSLRALKLVFSHAKLYRLIAENPARPVRQMSSKDAQEIRAFTRKEVQGLLDHYSRHPNGMYSMFVLIGARTGMRIGEIAGLTWNNIDLLHRKITIDKQWGRIDKAHYGLKPCKTQNSNRTIPIPLELVDALAKWRKVQPLQITGMVFDETKLRTVMNQLAIYIAEHYPGRSFHSLRHTFATLLLSETGDINLVAGVLGDTVATVSSTYVNYTQDVRDRAADSVERLFS